MSRRTDARDVTILHVSDTQFGQYHRFGEGAHSLADNLVRDLRRLRDDRVPPIDLIVLSGDIAERGLRSEYEQALRFIAALCEHTGLEHDRVVVVPGNHDVNWGFSKSYFDDCAGDEKEPREPYFKKWQSYQAFVQQLHGPAAFTADQPYRLHRFDDLGIAVAALNSTMRESHRPDDHYGWCGREQLRWFEDRLRDVDDLVRIGVVHHNVRRKADADNENLRDEDELTEILGPHLDLVLHGHTHRGREDRLADGTLVLATGSTAVTAEWRPAEVPNQYHVLQLRPDGLTRWAQQWADPSWIGDTRVSRGRNDGRATLEFRPDAWRRTAARDLDDGRDARRETVGRTDDLATRAERVTRRDVGPDALIERRRTGHPPLDYLVVLGRADLDRYVGIVDGALDGPTLDRFDELVFGPLRYRGGTRFELVHRGSDMPDVRRAGAERGIHVKTWTEYNDLLEPSTYAAWLGEQLAADRLYPQELYLPQRFRDVDRLGKAGDVRDDLLAEVYGGMLDDESRFVLILGEAGYGKSFLVRKLAQRLLDNEHITLTPIVIYLRDRDKRQTIEDMVGNVLNPSRTPWNGDRFRHSLEAGTLALLIDGYDEFAVRVGYTNAAAQLQMFVDTLRGRAKVLLTTRPNHFRSTDEVTSKLFDSLSRVHRGRVHQLEPFDGGQQRAFLRRWFELHRDADAGGTADRWMTALARVDNLPELARTPRMLSFMVQDLPLAEIEDASDQRTVTAADLYQRLLDRWLAVEATTVGGDDERAVPASERQRLLEDMALELWRIGERDVSEETLHGAARSLDLPRHRMTLDQAAQLIGGRTLLQVGEGRWKFAHQSVWEFLLANRLARILKSTKDPAVLGDAELTALTARFLRDLAPAEATAWLTAVAEGSA